MKRAGPIFGLAWVLIACVLLAGALAPAVKADEGWTIRSFDVTYEIDEAGTVRVTEDLLVDFGFLERHGIFRDIPVQYQYDSDYNRVTTITDVAVDDGANPWPYELIRGGPNLRIKIGDPARLVSGQQRYRISYTVSGGLNPFPDHDEFYWNVTGNAWPVKIEEASATVRPPNGSLERIACYEGAAGSTVPCQSTGGDSSASFAATVPLPPGSGLTIVVGLRKGAVEVPPLVLVPGRSDPWDDVAGFLGLRPLPIAAAIAIGAGAVALIIRVWWVAGRDRWYGDMFHVAEGGRSSRKPLGAHESIVTEFTPPEVDSSSRRRLRPAEIGLLVDERADTLDVTATIVDLAVRKYLVIKETESGGILGLFKKNDYELEKLDADESALLPYERRLLDSLFDGGSSVKLSDLKNKFYEDLASVKKELYKQLTEALKYFPRSPEKTRSTYQVAGGLIIGVGVVLTYVLGQDLGIAILGAPVLVTGGLLLALAPAMPRRTAEGRVMYRRALGFRRYIETAETARQEFAEKANIFQEYLPYAIVFKCVDKWAKAFEGLGDEATRPDWYYGRHAFAAHAFASRVNDFSESISSVMASTPGGRGGSGFGGGSSGGGGGGGGGGSW